MRYLKQQNFLFYKDSVFDKNDRIRKLETEWKKQMKKPI